MAVAISDRAPSEGASPAACHSRGLSSQMEGGPPGVYRSVFGREENPLSYSQVLPLKGRTGDTGRWEGKPLWQVGKRQAGELSGLKLTQIWLLEE